jgi:hypothetical protein
VSTTRRIGHGWPATVLAYGFRTGTALLLGGPLLRDLAAALYANDGAPLRAAQLTVAVEVAAEQGRFTLFWAAGTLLAYALLSPLVSMIWLCALAEPRPFSASVARASARYLPSLAISAVAMIATLAAGALALLALNPLTFSALPAQPWAERAYTGAVFAATALAALIMATLTDLTRGSLAAGARGLETLRRARRALSPRLLSTHGAFLAAAVACPLLAEALARALPRTPEALLFVSQQALVFLAVLVRAAWLCVAIEHTLPDEPVDA